MKKKIRSEGQSRDSPRTVPKTTMMKLPDYRKIAAGVERKNVFVEEREIDSALKWLQRSRAKFTLKNQAAQKGDFVEIEYWLPKRKEPIRDAFILGEGHFIAGFEEKLINMKAGETKEEPSLKIEMRSVQNIDFPEITDDFARGLGNFENLAALKKNIRDGLNLEKEQAESLRWRSEVLEKISQVTECEIPETLILEQQNLMMENLKRQVSEGLKISFQDYLDKIKKTEKEVLDYFLSQARKLVKNLLILREIGKREGLDPKKSKEYTEEAEKIEKIFQLLENFAKT